MTKPSLPLKDSKTKTKKIYISKASNFFNFCSVLLRFFCSDFSLFYFRVVTKVFGLPLLGGYDVS